MNYKALLVSLLRSIEGMGGYVHVCLCVFPWTGKISIWVTPHETQDTE